MDHQELYYAFRTELKDACRNPKGGFRASVSVKTILELECKYAEMETAMMDEQHKRVMGYS